MPHAPLALETVLARAALALPPPALRVLAGRPVEGSAGTLAPEAQLLLRLLKLQGKPLEDRAIPVGRWMLQRQSKLMGGHQPIGEVHEIAVPGATWTARRYVPRSLVDAADRPTLVFFHGGAMVYGSVETHDPAVRYFAEHAGVQVVSVEYRLAPEHAFPAPVEDCLAAYRWVVENVAALGADVDRLAVGGDSAGGYYAAVTAIQAAELGLPLSVQFLIYPVTEFRDLAPSRHEFGEGYYLSEKFVEQSHGFVPREADRDNNPLVSIVRRTSFPEGLARAFVVTAGFDPLRDEGEAYADLLAEHGVVVESVRYPSMIHGFFNWVGIGRESRGYARAMAETVGAMLRLPVD